jgi:2',3'-cyclic-nucleotide 2'-phosphodiesterase (5'-nucleotidase family)
LEEITMRRKFLRVSNAVILAVFMLFVSIFSFFPAAAMEAETRDLVILGTSDIHGNIDNYDYFTDSVPTGS